MLAVEYEYQLQNYLAITKIKNWRSEFSITMNYQKKISTENDQKCFSVLCKSTFSM